MKQATDVTSNEESLSIRFHMGHRRKACVCLKDIDLLVIRRSGNKFFLKCWVTALTIGVELLQYFPGNKWLALVLCSQTLPVAHARIQLWWTDYRKRCLSLTFLKEQDSMADCSVWTATTKASSQQVAELIPETEAEHRKTHIQTKQTWPDLTGAAAQQSWRCVLRLV